MKILACLWTDQKNNPSVDDFWFDEENLPNFTKGKTIVGEHGDADKVKKNLINIYFKNKENAKRYSNNLIIDRWVEILTNANNSDVKILEPYLNKISKGVPVVDVAFEVLADSLFVINLDVKYVVNHAVSGNIFETSDYDEAVSYAKDEIGSNFAEQVEVINFNIDQCEEKNTSKKIFYTHELPKEFYGADNKLKISWTESEDGKGKEKAINDLAKEVLSRSYRIVSHYRPSNSIEVENGLNGLARFFLSYQNTQSIVIG